MKEHYDQREELHATKQARVSTPFYKVGYSANLQQAIEYHCRGQIIPEALSKLCQHHANMLNVDLSNKHIQTPEPKESER